MTPFIVAAVIVANAAFFCLGRAWGLAHLDAQVSVAAILGAYGQTLRIESAATGVPIAALIEADQLAARDRGRR